MRSRRGRALLPALLLVAAACGSGGPSRAALVGGVYDNVDPCRNAAPLAGWTRSVGVRPAVYSGYGPDLTLPSAAATDGVPRLAACWARDYPHARGVFALPAPSPAWPVGAADLARYRAVALALEKANGGTDTVRLGWEFNGSWMPWSVHGDAGSFVANWRAVVVAMRAVAPSLRFDWNVANGWTQVDPRRWWPGDDYVDQVGVDAYDENFDNCSGTGPGYPLPVGASSAEVAARQRFATQQVVSGTWPGGIPVSLRGWAAFAVQHGKPVALDEWGIVRDTAPGAGCNGANNDIGGGDDPGFVDAVLAFAATHQVAYALYFDFCDDSARGCDASNSVDARIDGGHSPKALARLRLGLRDVDH